MSKEMQFDGNGATYSLLKGIWIDATLQYLNAGTGVWGAQGSAGATITGTPWTVLSSALGGIYYADAPSAIDLTKPYTILYYNAAAPTWGSHIGVQYYDPMSNTFSTMIEVAS